MFEIIDLEIDDQFGKIRRTAGHADIIDVAVMLGNHGRDLGQAARPVDVIDQDTRWKALGGAFVDVPAHVEPALRLFLYILRGRRLDRVDRDSLAGCDDAHDPVARYGSAVWRELDGQSRIDPPDRDC